MKKFDLSELKREKKRNRKERLEFVKMYADWIMKRPNKEWSKEHASFINSVLKSSKAFQKQSRK